MTRSLPCTQLRRHTSRPQFGAGLAALALASLLAAAPAHAQDFAPITSRDYRIDLFEQPALGSPRLIAMAGAINSTAEGAAGLFTNPASAAVRPETKAEPFAWSVYFNSYIPAKGQDFNNNGQPVTDVRRSLLGAAGLLLQYEEWGLSVDAGYTSHEISPQAGGGLGVRSFIAHLTLARTILDGSVAVGVSLRAGALNVFELDGDQTLFTRAGANGQLGVVWKPDAESFRVALGGGLPVYTGAMDYDCDPLDCYGYILPKDAIVPWDMTGGAAYRFGPTPWNERAEGAYRDERHLTVALELSVIGPVKDGHGTEAFAAKLLQPSGRDPSFTPRLGVESEVLPGWVRLRAGTYYEPARFEGVSPRPHGTFGAQARLFAFHFAGSERRVSLSAAGDLASRYQNVGLSLGFWN